jgi:HSP20 family molecular chaperone IbpA
MAISPPGFSGGPPPLSPHPRGNSAAKDKNQVESPEARAADAERDARNKIAGAERTVEDTQRETSWKLDRIKDEYQSQSTAEAARQEASIEAQKNKGYEQIRDLQRAQQQEINRVRRTGERDLANTQNYFRDTIYSEGRRGDHELMERQKASARELEQQQLAATDAFGHTQEENAIRLQRLKENDDAKASALTSSSQKEYERMRAGAEEATERATKDFQSRFEAVTTTQKEVLDNLSNHASDKIRDVRKDYSAKLAAYASRSKDPFYKLLDVDADITEHSDRFVVTARIPEHEQKHVSVSLKGSQLTLSGYRRNEEKLELSPGRSRGTAAFQSFSESFPLGWPVDGKRITKQFDGETLTITVPKKDEWAGGHKQFAAAPPEKARVERPHFPDNIPHTESEPAPDPESPEPSASKSRGSGSRTLT